jgi:GT2 family glycosyltransferase
MGRVPVIIPFYKAHDKLARCLAHLRAQTYRDVEVFVRDNSDDNVYYTAAVNEGLRKYSYTDEVRFVAILNQDAYLAPTAIESLVAFLERHAEAGIACPLQLGEEGEVMWGGSLQAFPNGSHRGGPRSSFATPSETPWANGAALVIRTEVVREIGVFDSNMRFLCSDADFSYAARARGWKIYVVPEAVCVHESAGSTLTKNYPLELIKVQDVLYFAKKWLSGDLFRSLSYEGSSLMRTGVRIEIEKLEKSIKQLEEMIRATPSPLA